MSHIFYAERTRDEDGSGWNFWRYDIDPAIVEAYEQAVMAWETERAYEFEALMNAFNINNDVRSTFVNQGAFDRSIDNAIAVRTAYKVMVNRLGFVADAVRAEIDDNRSVPNVTECDVVGVQEFTSRYLPIIREADANNGHEGDDPFGHWAWLCREGYTSIFNGR